MATSNRNQPSTSQAPSGGEQRGQRQTGLARRQGNTPAVWMDPLDFINPFGLLRRMRDEFDQVFSARGAGNQNRGDELSTVVWTPAIEVAERNGNLEVSAELPGLNPDNITVEFTNDALIIRGERQEEREETDGGVRRTELRYGQFFRAIALPDGADTEHAKAEFQNGVLRVTVPVPQERSNTRRIPVQAYGQSSESGQQQQQKSESRSPEKAA